MRLLTAACATDLKSASVGAADKTAAGSSDSEVSGFVVGWTAPETTVAGVTTDGGGPSGAVLTGAILFAGAGLAAMGAVPLGADPFAFNGFGVSLLLVLFLPFLEVALVVVDFFLEAADPEFFRLALLARRLLAAPVPEVAFLLAPEAVVVVEVAAGVVVGAGAIGAGAILAEDTTGASV